MSDLEILDGRGIFFKVRQNKLGHLDLRSRSSIYGWTLNFTPVAVSYLLRELDHHVKLLVTWDPTVFVLVFHKKICGAIRGVRALQHISPLAARCDIRYGERCNSGR